MKAKNLLYIAMVASLPVAAFAADDSMKNTSTESAMYMSQADKDLTAKVQDTFGDDKTLAADAKEVTVSSKDGVITLKGKVSSADARMRFERWAKGVDGVKSVDNQLEVSPK